MSDNDMPELNPTATFVKDVSASFRGTAKLFRLSPPLKEEDWDGEITEHEYVVVSGTHAMFSGPETYIFPSDSEGEVTQWGELNGSFRGDIDIERALRHAGYSTIEYNIKLERRTA